MWFERRKFLAYCSYLLCAFVVLLSPSSTCAAKPLRETIDARIESVWKQKKITPAEHSSDAEFLRRVFFDLLGTAPTYDETVSFLKEADEHKREKLIDKLLSHPRYAIHQADIWDMVYFGRNPPGYDTRKRPGFQNWLRDQFAKNVPYNVWAKKILLAEGNSVEQGAPLFFVQYQNKPEDATEAITQKFLGIQLQCARCHDHPFEKWTQEDFYGVAAFYARLRVVNIGKKNKQKAIAIGEMNKGDVLFTGPVSEQEVGQKGKPVMPKFLGGAKLKEPELPKDFKEPRNFPNNKPPPAPKFSRKNAMAEWITAPDNPYFARAAVNRVWAQFMGKGLVDPVDNLSEKNPASHPQLLNDLTTEFVNHKFDMRWLIKEILNSKTYQLSSQGTVKYAKPLYYERARFRPLSAEELLESWVIVSGYDQVLKLDNKQPKDRFQVRGITWDYMTRFFGSPNDGADNFQGGLQEHLYLNNGQVHTLISNRKGSLYDTIKNSKVPWEKRVDRLFLQILSRHPSPAETKKFVYHLSAEDDPNGRLHDAIWTLMTCSEYRFNH